MSFARSASYREEHSQSMDDRANLKPDICVPCNQRGHICKAIGENEAGERCCIFCLDGEPCLYEAATRRSRAAQPGHWLPEKAKVAEEKKFQRQEREKEKDKMPTEKICGVEGCGAKLQERNESGYCTKHYYISKKRDPAEITKCSTPGCDTKLRADNISGLCSKHQDHHAARKQKRKSKPGRAAPPPKSVLVPVTEAYLDNFWAKLSFEEKALALLERMTEE